MLEAFERRYIDGDRESIWFFGLSASTLESFDRAAQSPISCPLDDTGRGTVMGSVYSRGRLGWTAGITAGLFLTAGVVAFASGTPGTGAADAGPPAPIPQVDCGDPPPCTLPNGCAGVKAVCNQHGAWSGCVCNGGGGTAACTACGLAGGTGTCNASCQVTNCSGTRQSCNPSGCSQAGTQTCTNNAWGPCVNCGGGAPCTTTCGSQNTVSCAATCTPDTSQSGCPKPPETCNGKDDDCDGVVDNGITCAACDSP
jgi:hypothetical protein